MMALFAIALAGVCALPLSVPAAGRQDSDDDATAGSGNASSGPHDSEKTVWIDTRNFAKAGEAFQVSIYFSPPLKTSGTVTLDQGWGMKLSPSTVVIEPGQRKNVSATIDKGLSGVAWVHAQPSVPGYIENWYGIPVDFEAALKLNSPSTIPYDSPTSVSVAVVDKAGQPFRMPAHLVMHVEYPDGELIPENHDGRPGLDLPLDPGSETSPSFQLGSRLIRGGSEHLQAALKIPYQDQTLAQQDFTLQADASELLTMLLAVMGGLVHGVYKVVRLEEETPGKLYSKAVFMLLASALAGLIGYFFAHLDLLGLKIDPNVLRSYPLIGFLFSYFGFEVLIPKRDSGKDGTADPDAAPANPKG